MNKLQIALQDARESVGKNKLENAMGIIEKLVSEIPNNESSKNQLLHIRGQFTSLKESNNIGLMSHDEKVRAENKLRNSILNLITEIEVKISSNKKPRNKLVVSPKKKTYWKLIIVALVICFAFFGIFYFGYLPNKHVEYIADQKKIIYDSNIIIYLQIEQEWDTLEMEDEILEIATFDIQEGEYFLIEFDLSKEHTSKYEDLMLYLDKAFMTSLDFPPNIKKWKKDFSKTNDIIYKLRTPSQKEKLFFKANFLK